MIVLSVSMVSESRKAKKAKGKFKFPKAKKGKAKAKKAGGRSGMLKTVMPMLSGTTGDRLTSALEALDENGVSAVMDTIRDRMVKQILAKKKKIGVE